MQIIETSDLGVRAAILHLRRPHHPVEFVLFPMLHAGSADFYAEVQQRLEGCDLILVEGVGGSTAQLLTLAYRQMARSKRLDLVTQSDALHLGPDRSRVIHADLSAEEFARGWRQVPLALRLLLLVVAPLYGLYLSVFGTRDLIARYAEFNDLPSRDEVLRYDPAFAKLEEALTGQRDARVIQTIDEVLRGADGTKKLVGILFGARHLRAIIRYLTENHGYVVANAEWVTVFVF